MAVNTAALKTFAPAMRRQLMEAVGRKLDLLLNSQTPDTLSTYAKQIAELREEQEKSREQLLERVAYTWFNRLCALRYLDAKGWHPFGCKVLMPADGSEIQPELLKLMRSGSLPADLKTFTNEQRLNQLLDGQIPTAIPGGDAQGEVYRELVLAACRSYHSLLPDLFEGLDDASELLLPDDLLTEGSIAGSFRSSISDADCEDVEIIGWLYQFYISEKKVEVIGKAAKTDEIPAATQIFTPKWIAKYLTQNSLGAKWLTRKPNSKLKNNMDLFFTQNSSDTEITNRDQSAEELDPTKISFFDPCCGSGHILLEAYRIFREIYLECGYQRREIPELILNHNLHGIDICPRAAQLATLALTMKAREDDKRLFSKHIPVNIHSFTNSNHQDLKALAENSAGKDGLLTKAEAETLETCFKNARLHGSLISIHSAFYTKLCNAIKTIKRIQAGSNSLQLQSTKQAEAIVRQALMLAKRYDIVATNPPYLGSKGQNQALREFLLSNFKDFKSDLFAAFSVQCSELGKHDSLIAIMSPNVWMYLSSYESLRTKIFTTHSLSTLVELPLSGFKGATVQICAYTYKKARNSSEAASFIRLVETKGSDDDMEKSTKTAIHSKQAPYYYSCYPQTFKKIPGSPIAYWLSTDFQEVFSKSRGLGKYVHACAGLQTGNNGLFLRYWFEVNIHNIGFKIANREEANALKVRWFPCNKGGSFRRWAGNKEFVVNWQHDGRDIHLYNNVPMDYAGSPVRAKEFYFKPAVSWSDVTSGPPSFRFFKAGFIHEAKGMSAFSNGNLPLKTCLAYCNTPIATAASNALNPTLSFQVGNFENLPILEDRVISISTVVDEHAGKLIDIYEHDWNLYETSWDYQGSPLLPGDSQLSSSLRDSYETYIESSKNLATAAQNMEQEINSLFIESYELGGELSPEVEAKKISLKSNYLFKYSGLKSDNEKLLSHKYDTCFEILSYATGCMMGRYSLDHAGLILADSRNNQDDHLVAYEAKIGKSISEIQFKPDADAIIPVLDGEWFEDDIVARTREFLKVTFPESSVAENLRFIEDSIGKDIRKYFCKDFYKDHLQTYKKRPIYWMVQSPKAGFACLIYLHRYTPDTLLQVLNNYFRPYLQKLEARQEQLERDQNNDALPKREQTAARKEAEKITKVLKECQAWEQDALLPLAQQRIELDLDDGVKVNYLKLQEVLAKIPGLAAKGD